MSNYVSAVLTPEDKQEILADLAKIKSKLTFCIKLSPEEKKSLPKMDDGRIPFVQNGLQYGKKQPAIVPPYTDFNEYGRDLQLYSDLKEVEREATGIAEMITDTRMAAGADSYVAALSIYKAAKEAAKMGIPGTQAIVDDLKKLFDGQGNFKQAPQNK